MMRFFTRVLTDYKITDSWKITCRQFIEEHLTTSAYV